jgi:hypothetical protein
MKTTKKYSSKLTFFNYSLEEKIAWLNRTLAIAMMVVAVLGLLNPTTCVLADDGPT